MAIQENADKTELFERMPIPRAIMTLAAPTVISSLVMVLYNLTDTYFVGYLNNPVQNAAVTLAAPVLLAFNAVNNLFGVGAGTAMSRCLGRKDFDEVQRVSSFGFYSALACAAFFAVSAAVFKTPLLTLLGAETSTLDATGAYLFWTTVCGAVPAIINVVMAYLVRSEGSALHASLGTMSGCVLNMILDPIFILPFGLNMGAAGAGFATFISNCAACGYFFALLWAKRGKTYVCVSPRMARPSAATAKEVFGVGIPAAIQNLLNVAGLTALNNFAAAYGTIAVAAIGIAGKVNMIPVFIGLGITQGITPLIGYTYSSGNIGRMKECIRYTARDLIVFSAATTALYYVAAPWIIALFIDNEEVVRCGASLLRAMCLAIPFLRMDFLGVCVYQACGKGSLSLFFAIARKLALEIPALYVMNKLYPLYGLGYAQLIAEFILAVAAVIVLLRLLRKIEAGKA